MSFIRPVRRKRNPIYDKFYLNITKVFFLYPKWTKRNTIICEMSTKMEFFKSNRSLCNFYPDLPKTSFIHKMSKNKAHTWIQDLINTRNTNLQVKSTIWNFTQIHQKLSSISKWVKLKLGKWAKLKSMFEKSIFEIS